MGISSLHIREGHYSNGTTVLQIGYVGRITACDGGIYTCKANKSSNNDNRVQQRTFKLTYNSMYIYNNVNIRMNLNVGILESFGITVLLHSYVYNVQ